MRGVIGFAAMVIFAAAASAQGGMSGMSGMTAPTPAPLPNGWHLRTDSPKESPDAISFGATASGMHVTAGRSHAIYWNDANNATGTFTISGTFTQTKAPAMGHPEAYGIFWGGAELTGDKVTYLYFVIRGDGKYLVVHRADAITTHIITPWTTSPAINAQDATGKQVNHLEVRAGTDSVRFFANGKAVAAYDSGVATPGIYGFRVGHALDIVVEGFTKK